MDWCTSAEVLDVARTIKSSGLQAIGYDHINRERVLQAPRVPCSSLSRHSFGPFPREVIEKHVHLCVAVGAVDDCWGERDPTTKKIMGDPMRFPEGMPAFIAKLHGMGFKFGLCKFVFARLSQRGPSAHFNCREKKSGRPMSEAEPSDARALLSQILTSGRRAAIIRSREAMVTTHRTLRLSRSGKSIM
eukprot:SAG31_NODE_8757_length_1393_cov_1.642195_2_plen_189_part_00